MAESTNISWCDATFNPWIGCTKVSPACDNCYAERWDWRFAESGHAMHWGAGKPRQRTSRANWRKPRQWNAKAARDVKARRVEIAAVLSEWKRAYVVDGIERYRLEG